MTNKKVLFSGGPFDEKLWKFYRVTWQFVSRLCGSAPKEDLLDNYALGLGPTVRPPSHRNIPQTMEKMVETAVDTADLQEEAVSRSTVGFFKIGTQLVVPTYSIRAHIKDCIKQVESLYIGRIEKEKSFVSRAKNGLYVRGQAIDAKGVDINWIAKDGSKISESEIDGYQDRALHVYVPGKGQQNAIKRFAYLVKPSLTFEVAILGKAVKPEDLDVVFRYGATHGYGGERSMGEGRYTYEITEA